MKFRHLVSLLLMCALLLSLCACGESSSIPEGMQLCNDSDALGYTMYAPEGWVVCTPLEGISATYVSQVNQTSVTLASADAAQLSFTTDGSGAVAPDFQGYFDTYADAFPYAIEPAYPTATSVKLGNATAAASFVYTFSYQERAFKCMQILATFGDALYIFTYTASSEVYPNSNKTYYEQYYDYAKMVMDNLVFRAPSTSATPNYPADADGYLLVSDRTLCGFDFYMAPDFQLTVSSGIVGVRSEDGASVTMTEVTGTGVHVRTYFLNRLAELDVIADGITLITPTDTLPYPEDLTLLEGEAYKDTIRLCEFSNARTAAVCEYSYRYGGTSYRVLQYLAIKGNRGYAFTYTAPEDVFSTHRAAADRMAEKVLFQ